MSIRIAAIMLAVLSASAFVGWRVSIIRHPAATVHVAIVWDRSDSNTVGCGSLRSLTLGTFRLPGIGPDSTLALIATGDERNAYEGNLVDVFPLPFNKSVIEGQEALRRRQQQVADSVSEACKKLPRTKKSPVLSAVKSAVAHLKAKDCGKGVACFVFVVTDGEETVDRILHSALAGSSHAARTLRGTVTNDGIKVAFCGFAQTRIIGTGQRVSIKRTSLERLDQIWTSVFTFPDLISTAPYCPQ